MKTLPLVLASAITFASAGVALADTRCAPVDAKDWMPIEKIIEKAESLGYSVKETKRSDGCWEIEGFDRNGAEIEIRFEPATGEVVLPRKYRRP